MKTIYCDRWGRLALRLAWEGVRAVAPIKKKTPKKPSRSEVVNTQQGAGLILSVSVVQVYPANATVCGGARRRSCIYVSHPLQVS